MFIAPALPLALLLLAPPASSPSAPPPTAAPPAPSTTPPPSTESVEPAVVPPAPVEAPPAEPSAEVEIVEVVDPSPMPAKPIAQPEPVAQPAPPVQTDSTTSTTDTEPPQSSRDEPARRGPLLGVSLGYVGCTTRTCRVPTSNGWRYRGGPLAQFELGYRAGRLMPVASLDVGGGPVVYSGELEGIEGDIRFLDAGAGVMLFPVAHSRWDPFMGLRLGYSRAVDRYHTADREIAAKDIYSRFGVRLSAGLNVYVRPRIAIGPRFDITLPAGGGVCNEFREGERSMRQCIDSSSFSDGARAELPRWWSLSFGMHVVLPRRDR